MESNKNCRFCLIRDEKPAEVIYRDDLVFAFHDLNNGSAHTHILLCPIVHIPNVNSLNKSHHALLKHLKVKGEEILRKIKPDGSYR